MKDKKILDKAKSRFKTCENEWASNRKEALDDIKFARMGEQWDEQVKRQREIEGRPCLTINKLPAFIRQVVNDARLNNPAIKVHPQDDTADVETAEVINGVIRSIEENSYAEASYDYALECAVTNGFGYFRVDVEFAHDDSFDTDIVINRIIDPLSVYFDPNSTAVDGSDWNYCFVVEEMDKEVFKASYPNAKTDNWDEGDDGWVSDDTVRVCEYWERTEIDTELYLLANGIVTNKEKYESEPALQVFPIAKSRPTKTHKVVQRVITGAEILEETQWAGRYIPIIPCFGDEVILESKRHFLSLVRQAKDSQQNFNYWRTSATEAVALQNKAPVIGRTGTFDTDIRKWETMNTKNHAFIEYDGEAPIFTPPRVTDVGSIQEAMNASDDLKAIMGIYDASLGARSNETSGKAIMARQREGDVGTFHFVDNLSRAIRYAGRVILDLIPHVYNTPRVLRVLGYDGEAENQIVNQLDETTNKLHDLTKGKYDVSVEVGASFTSKREEAATQMTEMARAYPDLVKVAGDIIVKNQDWPGADELAKRLKVLLPPQIQALDKLDAIPPEAQAKVAQMEAQLKQLMQVMEQGKKLLEEKEQQIQQLEMANKDKSGDLAVKVKEIETKYETEMAKVQANLKIAEDKVREDQRELIVDTMFNALQNKVDALGAFQQAPIEDLSSVLAAITEQSSMVAGAMSEMAAPKTKTVSIKAPSGAVYEGQVTEA